MFAKTKTRLAMAIAPTKNHWSLLWGSIRTRLLNFKHQRNTACQQTLEKDFTAVLNAWGIHDEKDIPSVLWELKIRNLVFGAVIGVSVLAVALYQQFYMYFSALFICFPSLFGVLTTSWRMSVLTSRAFIPFTSWLCSLVTFTQKRS